VNYANRIGMFESLSAFPFLEERCPNLLRHPIFPLLPASIP
jgi:hypothetical protein